MEESAGAVKERTGLPIQVQLEPPDDFDWFKRLKNVGVDSLGMHLEAITPDVRARIMPSKNEVPLSYYWKAFEASVAIFGRGEVSTYLLAGLGDTKEALLDGCRKLIDIGVYPFVVPFVTISGTPYEFKAAPSSDFMLSILKPLGRMLRQAEMTSDKLKAGCAKCGACSALSTFEI